MPLSIIAVKNLQDENMGKAKGKMNVVYFVNI
jgi:hypothetical protein